MSERAARPRAPAITLTAVASGRDVAIGAAGVATLLICFAQETQSGIDAVEAAVRERWPRASEVFIAHVVDLRKVPGMLRRVAEGVLAAEHRKAVEALPAGVDARDYVVILPDWEGAVAKALGLEDVSKTLAVAAIDASGALVGTFQGQEPREAAMSLVEKALSAPK